MSLKSSTTDVIYGLVVPRVFLLRFIFFFYSFSILCELCRGGRDPAHLLSRAIYFASSFSSIVCRVLFSLPLLALERLQRNTRDRDDDRHQLRDFIKSFTRFSPQNIFKCWKEKENTHKKKIK